MADTLFKQFEYYIQFPNEFAWTTSFLSGTLQAANGHYGVDMQVIARYHLARYLTYLQEIDMDKAARSQREMESVVGQDGIVHILNARDTHLQVMASAAALRRTDKRGSCEVL